MKDTSPELTLVRTESAMQSGGDDDYYIDVDGKRAGYLYRTADDTWAVGVMKQFIDGDIGPCAQGLASQAIALDFARQNLPNYQIESLKLTCKT